MERSWGEPDSAFPTLSHWAAERAEGRARLSISSAESFGLCRGRVGSQTQYPICTMSLGAVYIAVQGRLSKPLLSLWSPIH